MALILSTTDEQKYLDQAGLLKLLQGLKAKNDAIYADKTDTETRLTDIETAIGDEGSVAEQIAAAVEAEATIARAAEEANAQAIADEIERATGAESDLQDAIDAEEAARKAQIGNMGTKVVTVEGVETTVDRTVEEAIAAANGGVAAEQERAEGAESDLQDAIDAEVERATGAESDLQDAIDAEEAARKAHIGDLGKVKDAEGKDTEADQTVKGYVDAAVAAINGDAETLEGRVAANETAIELLNDDAEKEGSVAYAVEQEAEARRTQIGTLVVKDADSEETVAPTVANAIAYAVANAGADVAAEVERATGAESDLQDAIDAEEAARKAHIGELGKQELAEGETEAKDHTVKSYVDAAIAAANGDVAAEVERATGAESDLQDAIDAEAEARAAHIGALTVAEDAEETVANAIAYAVAQANLNHLTREIVDALPEVANASATVIYMVKDNAAATGNVYDEYMLINGAFELIGSTETHLSNYVTKDDNITDAEITALLTEVFGE